MRPRVGFLGAGWIGRHRLAAIAATGAVEIVGVSDTDPDCVAAAREIAPEALDAADLDALLALDLDGVVIATPSALHAAQSIRALAAGAAVFCQKPLGRDLAEVDAVIAAAKAADRLLGVDLSYRQTAGMRRIHDLLQGGALGTVFAVDLVFHNAYGPDKPWFFDPALSGGGCVIDLGVHLVDLALWTLDFPQTDGVRSALYRKGRLLRMGEVEDYANASFAVGDTDVRLSCSWNLHAGQDAVIEARFHGTEGGATFRNVGGSFYDFVAEHHVGTATTRLTDGPDDWGGRAAAAWAEQLAQSRAFDGEAERFRDSALVLDRIYGR
jgi:predicted dehydrogenase